MPFFEVITHCPIHQKNVYIRVEADNAVAATNQVVGMLISCPWGPTDTFGHEFVVERAEIIGAAPLPWMPATIVSSAPGYTPLTPVPPTPIETLYYVNPDLQDRQLKKSRWWEK